MSKARGYLAKAKQCEALPGESGMANDLSARLSNAGGGGKRTGYAASIGCCLVADSRPARSGNLVKLS
jgi:hypothetical protein